MSSFYQQNNIPPPTEEQIKVRVLFLVFELIKLIKFLCDISVEVPIDFNRFPSIRHFD